MYIYKGIGSVSADTIGDARSGIWGKYVKEFTVSRKPARALFFCLCFVFALPAFAVDPVTPGGAREPFKKDTLTAPKAITAPPIKESTPARPKQDTSKRIQVNRFEISGNTEIPTKELISQIAELQGQKLTLEEIYAAADILTDYYRLRGYSLAKVTVPAQRINIGIIELSVVEGKLNAVKFNGTQNYEPSNLRGYLASLEEGKAITLSKLEHDLLLLNDLPGLTARSLIKPGPVFGTSDLYIDAEEVPFQGRVSLNNYGRVEIGEWRLDGEFVFNNLTGYGDQLNIALSKSEQGLLSYANIGYNVPVNKLGTRVGINVSDIDFNVAGEFAALDIEGDTTDVQLTLSHPVIRTRRENLLIGLGVGRNDSLSRTLGTVTRDNDINLVELSLLYNRVHANNAISSISAVLSSNFRSNPDGMRNNAQKAKLIVDGNHLFALDNNWSVSLRGLISLTSDPLVDSERFSIGGQGSVRGFQSAEIRGDSGYVMNVELRRRFNFEGTLPGSARVFFDHGRVFRKLPTASEEEQENLSSVGLGVTLLPTKQFSIDMEFARPIDAHATADQRDGGRFLVNLSTVF